MVSPDYLSAIYNEARKFSFVIQGYGSFEMAIEGLLKVNCAELIGVGYLSYGLPAQGTTEYESMLKFLGLCELLEDVKPVMFVTQTAASGLNALAKKYPGIDIMLVDGEAEITDTLINQSLFGNILCKVKEPYKLSKSVAVDKESHSDDWKLHVEPILQKSILQCLTAIDVFDTMELTLENDKPFRAFVENGDQLLASLRKQMVLKKAGCTDKTALEALQLKIDGIAEAANWCVLTAILEGIKA